MRYYFLGAADRLSLRPRKAPPAGLVIGAPSGTHLLAPSGGAALRLAVAVTVIVTAAEIEDAPAALAGDESERVHAGGGPQ